MRIETRPDGSLLLSDAQGPRWGFALAGLGAAAAALAPMRSGEVGVLGAVALAPLALIAALAGLAAARHRDWMLFDVRAREVVFRRGLGSIFRPVGVFAFTEVGAILVEPDGDSNDALTVHLLRAGDDAWTVATGLEAREADRLIAALRAVGNWPMRGNRTGAPRP